MCHKLPFVGSSLLLLLSNNKFQSPCTLLVLKLICLCLAPVAKIVIHCTIRALAVHHNNVNALVLQQFQCLDTGTRFLLMCV